MTHEVFGEISHWRDHWVGSAPMPRLATLAQSRVGEVSKQPPGMFAIHINDPEKAGPSAQQEAAFRHLQENEAEIAKSIVATLWRSYQAYLGMGLEPQPVPKTQEEIPKAVELRNVEISSEHQRRSAYLVFAVDCDWEPEHGMYVVYHQDTWHNESHRVHLSILKLSAGKLDQVRQYVEAAKRDFRDVIGPAEYPRFMEVGFVGVDKMSRDEVRALKNDDWQQYEAWMKTSRLPQPNG